MNFVNLRISGQSIDFERITESLSISPNHICKKDDMKYDKITKKHFTCSEDCWTGGIQIENEEETENKINGFIDLLYENKEMIQQLSKCHNITLWITLHPDTIQFNLHLSNKVLKKINELGIDIDITCMYLQEFYSGSYLSNIDK